MRPTILVRNTARDVVVPLPGNDRIAYRYPDCRRERSVSTAASCTFRYPVLRRNASEYGIPYCNKDENILNQTIELP